MGPHWLLATRPIMTRETILESWEPLALAPSMGLEIGAAPSTVAAVGTAKLWPASAKWTDTDFWTLGSIAGNLGVQPADLLAVLFAESALDPAAAARNPDGSVIAVGLNQITSILNSSLGITEAQRQSMVGWPVAQQLPYVEKSFIVSGVKKYAIPDAGGLYVANFAPGRMALGFGGDVVLYDSVKNPKEYAANKGADREKKGWISVENMRQMLRGAVASSAFRAALARYASVTGDTSAPRILTPSGAVPAPGETPAPSPPPMTSAAASGSEDSTGLLVIAGVAAVAAFVAMRG